MESLISRLGLLVRGTPLLTRLVIRPSTFQKQFPPKSLNFPFVSLRRLFISYGPIRRAQLTPKLVASDDLETKQVVDLVNNLIETSAEGRMFAVVQVLGKQFKITTNDVIVLEGYWPPDIGDQIRLEKVLLAASKDFTLIGRPLLPLNQVSVKATVIEKAMSHTRVRFKFIKRKQFHRTKLLKDMQTHLRINSIDILNKINDLGDVDGNVDRVF